MAVETDYDDLPIEKPEQDLFGIDPFVRSLARSLRNMKTPQGVVIALNGPWGSGKSSAMNLMRHHLKPAIDEGELELVTFNPWWFRGEEALVLAFFRELYAATKPTLSEKAKKVLPKLGARLLKAGGVVGTAADALGAGGVSTIASSTMEWLGGLIEDGESVEKLHSDLAKGLAEQKKRFVVLIDDIDRLAPDEALAMFRLVKSVGRLPNVIYLLAFDRLLAERVVADRFPSEGAHYLEKIVQASFELPMPREMDLRQHLLINVGQIVGDVEDSLIVHFMNLFHEIVAPEIHTPRDAIRFVNALSITWPAVAGEVDAGDFVALEAYRLFRPAIYQAIRDNPDLVCGPAEQGMGRSSITAEDVDAVLLRSVTDKKRYRRGLMRLFPRLESMWSNVWHSSDNWAKQRRACDEKHFTTYFRLSPSDDIVPRHELNHLLSCAGDADAVSKALLRAVSTERRNGGTQAAPLLDDLTANASEIPLESTRQFLAGIFAVADQLDIESDREKGFMSFANNALRIHWLLRALLRGRTSLEERSSILMSAAKQASLGWLTDLASSAWNDYHPRQGKEPEREDDCLVTEADAGRLVAQALLAIKRAARDGTLTRYNRLAWILYRWREFSDDEGWAVKRWTTARIKEEDAIARLAAAFTSTSWSQSMGFSGLGDLVAIRHDQVHTNGLETIIDSKKFEKRLRVLSAKLPKDSANKEVIDRYLKARDKNDSD